MSVAAIRRAIYRLVPDRASTDAALVAAIAPTGADREAAFAELVSRYGPMVLGVCRGVLADTHDAEDAFQAVFLVLARKSATIRPPGAVGGWLYGVAVRTAQKAKTAAARRRRREMNAVLASRERERPEIERERLELPVLERAELRAIIDTELAALPESHRAAIVMCDLQGKKRAEAARELDRAEGTVASWLARGRKTLAARLARRGVTLPTAGLATVVTPSVVSAELSTAATATLMGSGISATVLTLAEGVMRSLTLASTKLVATVVATGAVLVAMATAGVWHADPNAPPNSPPVAAAAPKPANVPAPKAPWREKAVLWETEGSIHSVAFSPDGKQFATGGVSGDWCVWDATKLEVARGTLTNDPHPAALAYSPDSKQIASTTLRGISDNDSTFKPSPTGKVFAKYFVEDKSIKALAVAFGPVEDVKGQKLNRLAYTNGKAVWATTWLDGGAPSTATFGPLADAPKIDGTLPVGIAYSPDGKRLVFIPNHKVDEHWIAQVWGGGSGEPMQSLKHGAEPVTAIAWAKEGNLIATGGAEGDVVLWDAKTYKEVRRVRIGGRNGRSRIHALAFTADGKTLAAALEFEDGKNVQRVVILEPSTGTRVQDIQSFFDAPPQALAFSPDGKTLVVGCGFRDPDREKKLTPEARKKIGAVHVFTTEPPAKKEEPKPARASKSPIPTAWGKPVNGLQAGIRVKAGELPPGAVAELEVVVRNISEETIEFQQPWGQGFASVGKNEKGVVTVEAIGHAGFALGQYHKVKLAPGEIHDKHGMMVIIPPKKDPWFIQTQLGPGTYRIGCDGFRIRYGASKDILLGTGYLDVVIPAPKK